jgi:hypothetical protein
MARTMKYMIITIVLVCTPYHAVSFQLNMQDNIFKEFYGIEERNIYIKYSIVSAHK